MPSRSLSTPAWRLKPSLRSGLGRVCLLLCSYCRSWSTNMRTPKDDKPIASLSVDLDNQWSYMKTHGDRGWDSFPSYLDLVVPRILGLLEELDLTVTFFIVGQDAAMRKNEAAMRLIAAAGHEIGNHSFHHDPWIHLYTERAVEDELTLAEEHIERVTGQRPVGYRAPGYSLSNATLRALQRRGLFVRCLDAADFYRSSGQGLLLRERASERRREEPAEGAVRVT